MNKLTKKIGLLMLVLVLALCPVMMFTGCGEKDADTSSAMLAEAKTEFNKILSLYTYDITTGSVPASQFASYSCNLSIKLEELANGEYVQRGTYEVIEAFTNENGNLQLCARSNPLVFYKYYYIIQDGDSCEYFAYYKDEDGYEKYSFSTKSAYDESIDPYLIGMIAELLDSHFTFDYKSASKTGSVYSITMKQKYADNNEVYKTLTIEFDAELKQINKIKEVKIYNNVDDGNGRSTYEYTFNYSGNITFTVPQDVKDATVNQ